MLSNVKTVSCGSEFTKAILNDGSLYAWGLNEDGQLGDGTKVTRYSPVKVDGNVKEVACAYTFTLYITASGDFKTVGKMFR